MVSDVKVADLANSWSSASDSRDPATSLAVNLVVTGGAGAIEPAVTWVARSEGLDLRAVEFALRDEEDLAHNAGRLVQVVDSLDEALDDVPVFAEPPMPHGHATARLARCARRARSSRDRAEVPHRRAVATTCSRPRRSWPPASRPRWTASSRSSARPACTTRCGTATTSTGFEHHGFLNVLLATRTSLDGGGPEEVARVLDETDGCGAGVAAVGRP